MEVRRRKEPEEECEARGRNEQTADGRHVKREGGMKEQGRRGERVQKKKNESR